jgi:hypothetical protein
MKLPVIVERTRDAAAGRTTGWLPKWAGMVLPNFRGISAVEDLLEPAAYERAPCAAGA